MNEYQYEGLPVSSHLLFLQPKCGLKIYVILLRLANHLTQVALLMSRPLVREKDHVTHFGLPQEIEPDVVGMCKAYVHNFWLKHIPGAEVSKSEVKSIV